MKQCFHEDPNDRPPFNILRDSIAAIFDDMKQNVKVSIRNARSNTKEALNYIDIGMKERYLDMRRHNKNTNLRDCIRVNDAMSFPISSHALHPCDEEDMGRYLSLEFPDMHQDNLRSDRYKEFGSLALSPNSLHKNSTFSKSSSKYNPYLTYSGENVSKESIRLQNLQASQSCNPLYFMSKSQEFSAMHEDNLRSDWYNEFGLLALSPNSRQKNFSLSKRNSEYIPLQPRNLFG
jgi:hypothetical protein